MVETAFNAAVLTINECLEEYSERRAGWFVERAFAEGRIRLSQYALRPSILGHNTCGKGGRI
jgi:hypothetical protein